jgi:hypothetical protein
MIRPHLSLLVPSAAVGSSSPVLTGDTVLLVDIFDKVQVFHQVRNRVVLIGVASLPLAARHFPEKLSTFEMYNLILEMVESYIAQKLAVVAINYTKRSYMWPRLLGSCRLINATSGHFRLI